MQSENPHLTICIEKESHVAKSKRVTDLERELAQKEIELTRERQMLRLQMC